MTEKQLAWLTCIQSKEKEMVRKQHFFPHRNRKHAYKTVHLQSMKREHLFQEEAVALRKEKVVWL